MVSRTLHQKDKELTLGYRLKLLKEEPYTQKEADAAAGLGTDNGIRAGKLQSKQATIHTENVEMHE